LAFFLRLFSSVSCLLSRAARDASLFGNCSLIFRFGHEIFFFLHFPFSLCRSLRLFRGRFPPPESLLFFLSSFCLGGNFFPNLQPKVPRTTALLESLPIVGFFRVGFFVPPLRIPSGPSSFQPVSTAYPKSISPPNLFFRLRFFLWKHHAPKLLFLFQLVHSCAFTVKCSFHLPCGDVLGFSRVCQHAFLIQPPPLPLWSLLSTWFFNQVTSIAIGPPAHRFFYGFPPPRVGLPTPFPGSPQCVLVQQVDPPNFAPNSHLFSSSGHDFPPPYSTHSANSPATITFCPRKHPASPLPCPATSIPFSPQRSWVLLATESFLSFFFMTFLTI